MENRDDAVMSGLFILHDCCCGGYGAVGGRGLCAHREALGEPGLLHTQGCSLGEGMHSLRSSQKAERGHVN